MRIQGEKVEIDETSAKAFWQSRAQKYSAEHPYVCVNLGDSNPERSEVWHRYEQEHIMPLLGVSSASRILDIGCGIGRLAEIFVPVCKEYAGVDYSAEFIEIARRRVPQGRFQALDIKDIESVPGKFNLLVFNEILFYCNDQTVHDAFQKIPALCEDACKIYVNNAVAVESRLTLKDFYSQELESEYSSIYRTEEEYVSLYRPLLDSGFRLVQKGNFEIGTAGRETKRIFHILEREALSCKP